MVTPLESRWLFIVVKVRKIQDKRLGNFHSVFMKLIWIAHGVKPDCDTTISFLCTRINFPYI